jgi:hypothetical protein
MDESIFIPITAFAMVVAIVWVVQAYVSRNRSVFMETVRSAIDKGVQLSPETIKALGAPKSNKHGDIKWGTIWVAVALAFITLGWSIQSVEPDEEVFRVMAGVAAFPGFVGLALLGYGLAMLRAKE